MPISFGSEFTIGSTDLPIFGRAGSAAATAVLNDGRIAVVWQDLQLFGGDFPVFDTNITTRILNADGSGGTAVTEVNSDRVGAHSLADVAALADGGYAVIWSNRVLNNPTVPNNTDQLLRVFNADGSPRTAMATDVTADIMGQDDQFNENDHGTVLGLAGGGMIVTYTLRGSDATYARTVAADGVTMGPALRIFETATFSNGIEQLANGDVLLYAYNGQRGGVLTRLSGPDLVSAPAGVPGATGPVTRTYDTTTTTEAAAFVADISALPGGGFAMAYLLNADLRVENDDEIRVDFHNAAGDFVRRATLPLGETVPGDNTIDIQAVSGDRVLLTFEQAVDFGNTDLMAVLINADGRFDGALERLHTTAAGGQTALDMDLTASGDVVAVFTDASGVAIGGTVDQLHGRIINIPDAPADPGQSRQGTAQDDLLQGGSGNDTLDGLAGNDTINGGDGADRLIGGEGDDIITGGATIADLRDVVFGGDGNDTIDGGYGNDELRGDAGNDNIAGGFGADTVIGGTGNDTLTGSAFGDEIFGGDGMDFINGGFGSDRVNGGAGDDTFYHLGIADHGSDWIQDFNGAEDLLHFGGTATRDQFQINTANTPMAGDANLSESFIIYRPTGQILWALVDGDSQDMINMRIGSEIYDLTT